MTLIFLILYILSVNYTFAEEGTFVSSPWAEIPKKIYIQIGARESAWLDRYTTYYEMVPCGDGTYVAKTFLLTGNLYNFIFFASTEGVTYYDTVPSEGRDTAFIISNSSYSIGTLKLEEKYLPRYDKIGGDTRRVIFLPPSLPPDTTVYIYSNWSSTPNVVENFRARPGNKQVVLTWEPPYGYWGKGGKEFLQADVIYGGFYQILRSTSPEGEYVTISTVPGKQTMFVDTDVENGKTYYYAIVTHDAYKSFLSLCSQKSYTLAVTPNEPIQIRFRVEGIDLKKLKKQFQNIVYLTPVNETDKYSTRYKLKARFTYCKVRRKFLGIL
jgi:hypothetical protein